MPVRKIGAWLAVLGVAGALLTVLLANLIKPCCIFFMHTYHQMQLVFVPIFIAILGLGLYLFLKEGGKRPREIRIEKILTADERAVIRALRKRNMTQADLRQHLQFSKAKLSVLLARMAQRRLLRKMKRGRTNIVVLRA